VKKGSESWILINEGAHGFARVDYPESVLNALREPITQQLIAPADRYALIRDSFDLAQGGISSVDKALAFVDAYRNETNFAVWSVIAEKLGNVANILDGEPIEVQTKFDTFAQSIFRPVLDRVGWDKKPGESNKDAFLRELAIASLGEYGDPDTITKAHEKFAAHTSGETPLDPDLRRAVYKIVAANGTEVEYQQFMDLYRKTDLQEEKVRILVSLGSFTKPNLIEQALAFAIPDETKESAPKANAYMLMTSLFKNPYAREKAWEFTKEHWDTILETYGDAQLLLRRFIAPAAEFHSLETARDIEAFFATHKAPSSQRTIQQVVETIISKADWLTRDKEKIVNFLAK
jgi:puromycin-sensitive aminopeptidase